MNTETPQFRWGRQVRKCLVVDNIHMNLRVLQAMLELIGVKATAVLSAQEALEKLKVESYDLVMTDLWMPQMSGAQMVKQIRRDQRFADLPILAVTADPSYQDNFDMSGFDGVLLKPIEIDSLKAALRVLTCGPRAGQGTDTRFLRFFDTPSTHLASAG